MTSSRSLDVAGARSEARGDRAHGGKSALPLWFASAPDGPELPPLAAEIEADVLVIGGGIAGLSTALHLAEAGVDVALLEAEAPGAGATGQSGGLVAPDYIRHTPETIRTALGADAGERLTQMIGSSAATVFGLIERHVMDCDARQDGFYTPAHNEALAANQRQYARQWSERGHAVEFIDRAETQHRFGIDRYCGALRFVQGGSLNPLGYARGLARAALGQGARIFAASPVASLSRQDGVWLARTPHGAVSARRLVLAANGGNAGLHPALRRTTLPLHVIQFATEPLTDEQRAHILPEGGAFTDKVPYLFTARLDGAGRLISAFPVSLMVRGERAFGREARRRLKQHFALLSDPRVACLWKGLAQVNSSFLPELYDLGDDALAIQADNGRGISVNTMLGIEVATMLARGDRETLSVRPRAPSPIRLHTGAALLPKVLMSMAYLSN